MAWGPVGPGLAALGMLTCWFAFFSASFPRCVHRCLHAFPSGGDLREGAASDENPALLVGTLPSKMAL